MNVDVQPPLHRRAPHRGGLQRGRGRGPGQRREEPVQGGINIEQGGINAIVSLSVEAGAKCCHIPTSGGKPTMA